jgi:hypothetical protein
MESSLSSTSRADRPRLVWLSSLLGPPPLGRDREFCRERLFVLLLRVNRPMSRRPPDMHGSRNLRMLVSFLSEPSSTMTPPLARFHDLATSSRRRSASPSSLQPLPQYLPMNIARDCRAEDVKVRLCFFVRERKASGRRVGGGRRIGRTVDAGVCAAGTAKGCASFTGLLAMGYAGVPKAGEEDGRGSLET